LAAVCIASRARGSFGSSKRLKVSALPEIRASILKAWDNRFPSLYPSLERSLRRALKKLADDEIVLAIGDGGRADPTRYCLHPVFRSAEPDGDPNAAFAAVQAIPGGADAIDKRFRRRFLRVAHSG
jgi:hypothetical protein